MTVLKARTKGTNSSNGAKHDATLQTGGITINQDAYDATLDRIYDVKGLANMHIEIENEHATNGLIYKIEKAREEFATLTDLGDADFDQDVLGNTIVAALVAAFGTATLATVLAGSTITINGLLYTAVTGVKSDDTEFSIDGSDTVDAADLADSIQNDTRIGTLKDVTATSNLGVVTCTSTAIGAAGNAVTLAEDTGSTTIIISGANFTDGINNFDIRDIEGISPESTAIRIRVRRQTAGNNATLAGIVSVN